MRRGDRKQYGDTKRCPKCKKTKLIDDFYILNRKLPSGEISHQRSSRCKQCVRKLRRENGMKNRARESAARLAWKKANPERTRENNRRSRRNIYNEHKRKLYEAYGGRCECCGETDPHFLTLEHKNGLPDHHKRNGRRITSGLLRIIENEGYPDDYCLLCWNCNSAKGRYGICPHKMTPETMYYTFHLEGQTA